MPRYTAELARLTLLHDEDLQAGWPEWLEAVGQGRPDWGARGPRLADGALLLQAAAQGLGVALARHRLAVPWLEDGRLARPLAASVSLGSAYWLVLPPRGTPLSPQARAFAGWVRAVSSAESLPPR